MHSLDLRDGLQFDQYLAFHDEIRPTGADWLGQVFVIDLLLDLAGKRQSYLFHLVGQCTLIDDFLKAIPCLCFAPAWTRTLDALCLIHMYGLPGNKPHDEYNIPQEAYEQ